MHQVKVQCSECPALVILFICKTGSHIGQWAAHHANGKAWWYFWLPGTAPIGLSILPPQPPSFVYSPTASPLIASGSSQIPAGPLAKEGMCTIPSCHKGTPARGPPYENLMCKYHCIENGGCMTAIKHRIEFEPEFEEVKDFGFDADLELARSRSLEDLMPVLSVSTAISSSSLLVTSSSQLPAMQTISKDPKSVTQPSGKSSAKATAQSRPQQTTHMNEMWYGTYKHSRQPTEQMEKDHQHAADKLAIKHADCQPPVILSLQGSDGPESDIPTWLHFSLADSPDLQSMLGENITTFEYFNISSRLWKAVTWLAYKFHVKNGDCLFLQRHGVLECVGINKIISRLKDPAVKPHLFLKMKQEASLSSSLPDILSEPLADELQPSLTTATWPNGLYIIDIVAGFERMDSDELKSLPVRERFKIIYDRKFNKSTYNNARQRWKEASDTFRTQLTKAGRTPFGLWDVLHKAIPLRKKTVGTQSHDDKESDIDINLTL
ncbi:hypothetical protein F4604DRAFT_1683301 [Suillus subluteus]|nr:hypothetical protein F4604DRAFT_1683301 [Suillus subluteus]